MQRRSFLGAIGGLFAGLFGGKAIAVVSEQIRIKGKPTVWYGKYRLGPCAVDFDGTVKPLNDIIYPEVKLNLDAVDLSDALKAKLEPVLKDLLEQTRREFERLS